MRRLLVIIFCLTLGGNHLPAQGIIDTLKKKLRSTPEKERLALLIEIAEKERLSGNLDSSIHYADSAYTLAESMDSLQKMGKALDNLGLAFNRKGQVPQALDYLLKALVLQEKIDDQKGLQSTYNGLGVLFLNNGNPDKALKYLYKGLEISKQYKDSVMLATQLYNIGLISYESKEYDNALAKFEEALRYGKTPKAKRIVAYILGTQGSIFSEKGYYKTALSYFEKSLKLKQEINDLVVISSTYQSMGIAYSRLGNNAKALQMHQEALRIREKSGYATGTINSYNQLANTYIAMNDYSKARALAQKAYDLSVQLNQSKAKATALENLFYLESQEGNCREAVKYYHQMTQIKDSLNVEEINRNRIQTEMNYNFDKKLQSERQEQEQKDLLTAERMQRERQFSYSLIIVVLLAIALTIVALRNSHRRRKDNRLLMEQQVEIIDQKKQLEAQHSQVLNQQKEINDSICYAQRIQNALFPVISPKETFPGAFAFIQPKNIISGDFYWVMAIGKYKVAAVVDCTGHGVPGGFMSILGINFMNEIVLRSHEINAAQVLQKMRHRVIEALHQSELTLYSNDGMDMSLCIFDTETNTVDYASANGKAILYQKSNSENPFTTLAVDRMPVSYYVRNEPFSSTQIAVTAGDILFMYTDGFTDQYGGNDRQRKLGQPMLKTMLEQVVNTSPNNQEELISRLFNDYKGKNMQYDDVLLLAIPF